MRVPFHAHPHPISPHTPAHNTATPQAPCISLGSIYNGSCYESYPGPLPEGPGGKVTSIYKNTSVDAADDTMPDGMIAAEAVKTLKTFAGAGTKNRPPFFMAVYGNFDMIFGPVVACLSPRTPPPLRAP